MIRLVCISKRYGQALALEPTDLDIAPGRTTVLIGPSGSGKSTILRIVNGLVRPDTGSVIFDGSPLTDRNVLSLRRRMGYVIQEGGLFPHLTAQGNVLLMARHLGWAARTMRSRLQELLELAQLPQDVLARYPTELSGGQRQRVSLIRALMLDPDVLLLDEPLAALDPMVRYDLQNDLKRIFQRLGKTVVLVTHDMGEAAFFGDEIVLLRDGRIVQQGTLEDLLCQPRDAFVQRFINAQRNPLILDRTASGACPGAPPCPLEGPT